MAISLTELVKDFADAAVTMDQRTRASSMLSLIGECDHCEEGGHHATKTEKLVLAGGQEVEVPTAVLKQHSGLQAQKLVMTIDTEAILQVKETEDPKWADHIHGHNGEEATTTATTTEDPPTGPSTGTDHEAHVKEVAHHETAPNGTQFDIMVTFTDGLHENASRLTLTAEFNREPPPEGVALVNDRLTRDLGDELKL